ncbi:hypothetical protein DERP_013480 [Dermatophagoides pteronyssinus]|uniref:Uncharacterized protein n=1 Tax=Dermatophagoides pteronyssinus TaxID=6956 RepID=A0ABQ8JRP7_DERPT|nr:hypothetical protein DERP_013480 [Dermatophagoides pteronyssinus]
MRIVAIDNIVLSTGDDPRIEIICQTSLTGPTGHFDIGTIRIEIFVECKGDFGITGSYRLHMVIGRST